MKTVTLDTYTEARAALLNREPARIRVNALPRAMSLSSWNAERPSGVPLEELARLNQVAPDSTLPSGWLIKWVSPGS